MFKVAKGTQDLVGKEYTKVFDLIQRVEKEFRGAGGQPLETPVFERTDVLLGKYGEEADTKLIYRLADEGGELLALRYDLTIPFTRYVKENGVKQIRRYSIGKVYRRDQPSKGRYREFYQADFDIYGEKQEEMLAEATLLNTVCRVLKGYNLDFKILINDVRNLRFMLETELQITEWKKCCPIIDKLDKQPFNTLLKELSAVGLTDEQIQKLQECLQSDYPLFKTTQYEYTKLVALAEVFDFKSNIVFTNALARGLDYYTGFIWEIKLEGVASTISAGGRYDTLLNGPAVGISVGISRLASYLAEPQETWQESYYVVTVGTVSLLDKMKVVKQLQNQNKSVMYSFTNEDKKLGKVITECCKDFIRYVVIVGESEIVKGEFCIKDLQSKTQETVTIK